MRLSDISGNEAAKKMISGAANGGAFHAYIISGAAGSGKRLAAAVLASGLVCTAAENRPCGECAGCRKAQRDAHPDIITEHMEGKASFLSGQARKLRADAYIKPNEAERKVYILPDAAYMHHSAQNIMLKLLEEPPEYAVFLLICETPGALLETVRSRCIEISMKPVSADEALAVLRGKFPGADEARLRAAADAGGGYIGRGILALSGGNAADAAGAEICRAIAAVDEKALYRGFFALERLGRDELSAGIAAAMGIMRDALAQKNGGTADARRDFAEISAELARRLPSDRLAAALLELRLAHAQSGLYLAPGNLLAAASASVYGALL